MSYSYLVKSPRHLVQYVACNLLTKEYFFYSTAFLPEGKDPVLVDAKLSLLYDAHFPKEKKYRRRKAGHAAVRYLRCGRLCLLFATKGRSPFFEREAWRDVRESPLHIAGHALKVHRDTGKVSVRIHREAQREIRRALTERANWSLSHLEGVIRGLPFLAFAGVQDNVTAEVEHLNACRKSLRLPPVSEECIRRFISVGPVFLPTPPELLELLRWESKKPLAR